MRKKLFLSSLFIILITIALSMLSVNLVFQKHFSDYLSQTMEATLDQLPEDLSNIYQARGEWDVNALNNFAHNLPLGTEIELKSSSGKTILTLVNPMQKMHGSMGMGMNMGMGYYSVQEWKTKTLNISGPEGTIATAIIRYPASARILNPQDISFTSAVFRSFLYAGLLALLIGIFLSYWTSRRLVSPLQRLTNSVQRVGEGHLDEYVPITTKDEVGELAIAFNNMTDSLNNQQHLRKQFTADIAHELRTPLTSIRSYIEAFQDGILPANEENFSIIIDEIERLANLSSDLKDLNVAEIGGLKPNFTPIYLDELLDKTISNLYSLIREKRISINWKTPKFPIVIQGDEHLLTRLFYNLIHNAYKYSESNTHISIQIEDSSNEVLVHVHDSGIGIAEEDLPYIFERFYRADKSRARETGGTGIGLALVKQITQLHKGKVNVESKVGQGSLFTVSLPKK